MLASNRTIVVVEDDVESRLLLTRQLERAGYEVIAATHGGEALHALADHPDALVVLDLHLPIIDGMQVLYELWRSKRQWLTRRTVVASADVDAREKVQAFGVGAMLKKPFTQEQLLAAMATVQS